MVNACVVVVMGEEGEDKYLVAYIVPEGKTSKKDIRAALKRRLPFYMIPSYFVLLNRCVCAQIYVWCASVCLLCLCAGVCAGKVRSIETAMCADRCQ